MTEIVGMNESTWQDRSHDDICCCLPLHSLLESRTCGPGDRRAHANQSVKAGQVVVRNVPLAFVVHDRNERCAACFQKSTKLMRCSKCQQTWYCSRECQKQDFPSHRIECRNGNKLFGNEEWQLNARLLLRTILTLQITDEEGCRLETDGGNGKVPTCNCSKRHFLQLQACKPLLDTQELQTLQITLHILMSHSKLLSKMGINFVGDNDSSVIRTTLETILGRFRVNNFGMIDSMVRLIGSGVYPLGALLNHSCSPNCILRYTNRGVLEIVACRDIEQGEELTHSYIELVASTSQRQKHLWDIYGFTCDCPRCGNKLTVSLPRDYTTMPRDELVRFVLDHYKKPTVARVSPGSMVLISLDDLMEPRTLNLSVKERVHDLQQQANLAMTNDDVARELDCLALASRLLMSTERNGDCFHFFSLDLYSISCQRLSTLIVAQESQEALKECQYIVAYLCLVLSKTPNHPLLGLQLFTLGDLYQANGQTDLALQTYQWTYETLLISQGRESDMISMLKEKLR